MLMARPSLLLTVNILMVLLLKLAHISSNFMQIILRMFNRYIFPCNVEAVSRKYSVKNLFWKISQNLQGNTYTEVYF